MLLEGDKASHSSTPRSNKYNFCSNTSVGPSIDFSLSFNPHTPNHTTMAPSNMKAIKVVEAKKAELQDVPVPKLRDDYVLVKVEAVALNPTDWKHVDYLANPGATVGCDYAGVVEEVGSAVQKKFSKGDRIAGFSHGVNSANKEDGCFAQYALSKGDVQMKVPDSLSTEDAATLGVGVTTVGQVRNSERCCKTQCSLIQSRVFTRA